MIWEDIIGFDGRYQTNFRGEVRNAISGRVVRFYINPVNGYVFCVLSWKGKSHTRYKHRLIAEYFIPNPFNLPEVNHDDGDKQNNVVNNLKWTSHLENMGHAVEIGLMPNGERKCNAKLNTENVIEIKAYSKDVSHSTIARVFNVSPATISKIRRNIRWKHLS